MSRIKSEKVNFTSSVLIKLPAKEPETVDEKEVQADAVILEATSRAQAEARKIVEEAHARAQKMLDDTQAEIDRAKAQVEALREIARLKGEQEGFKGGYEQGKAQVLHDLEEKIKAFDLFTSANFEVKQKILKSAQKEVLELCMAVCRKVCHKTLDRESVLEIVKQALSLLEGKESVNILISPYIAELLGDTAGLMENVNVQVNPKIAQDAIIVEALGDRIDCSVSAQLDEITAAFKFEAGNG